MKYGSSKILTIATTTAVVLTFSACDAPDSGADDAASTQQTEERVTLFPDAPNPQVRQAVRSAALDVEEGGATFYADKFEGRRTASGRTFRQGEMVAAHRAFPFGTRLRVTNLRNQNQVEVTVVDRGPFGSQRDLTPVLDLSRAAAQQLDFINAGRAQVRIEVLEWGSPAGQA